MFLERFCNYLKYEKRYSGYTLLAYSKDLKEFDLFLKSRDEDFSSAQPVSVRAWIVELMHRADASTINRKLSSLRSFYKFLNREKLIVSNPVHLIKALKTPKRLPLVVKEAGINSLLDSDDIFPADFSGLRDKLIIELLFGSGMRLSELLFIKEEDVNLYDQNIRIMGKRNKERIVPLNRPLLELIRHYISEKHHCGFGDGCANLIVTSKGEKAYASLVYRVVRKYLGYITTLEKRSPHVLRHSYATSLLDHGADLNAIKELLGHASLAATQVYTHNSVEKLKSIYKQAHPKA